MSEQLKGKSPNGAIGSMPSPVTTHAAEEQAPNHFGGGDGYKFLQLHVYLGCASNVNNISQSGTHFYIVKFMKFAFQERSQCTNVNSLGLQALCWHNY